MRAQSAEEKEEVDRLSDIWEEGKNEQKKLRWEFALWTPVPCLGTTAGENLSYFQGEQGSRPGSVNLEPEPRRPGFLEPRKVGERKPGLMHILKKEFQGKAVESLG